jgi:glycyl-tRNA synthetase beta subunit
MDDYKKYEADCKKIRRANQKLLTDFESWLKSSGLSDKTIKNHGQPRRLSYALLESFPELVSRKSLETKKPVFLFSVISDPAD